MADLGRPGLERQGPLDFWSLTSSFEKRDVVLCCRNLTFYQWIPDGHGLAAQTAHAGVALGGRYRLLQVTTDVVHTDLTQY